MAYFRCGGTDNKIYLFKMGKYPHPEITTELIGVKDGYYGKGELSQNEDGSLRFYIDAKYGSYYSKAYFKDTNVIDISPYKMMCARVISRGNPDASYGYYGLIPRLAYLKSIEPTNKNYSVSYATAEISYNITDTNSKLTSLIDAEVIISIPLSNISVKTGGWLGFQVFGGNWCDILEVWLEK